MIQEKYILFKKQIIKFLIYYINNKKGDIIKNKIIFCILILLFIVIFTLTFKHYKSITKDNLNHNTNVNLINNQSNNTDEEDYYLVVNGNATYKTGDINKLYDNADLVVIGEYLNDVEVNIKKNSTPITTSSFKIKKVIKSNIDFKLTDTINVKYSGGVITVKQLLDSRDQDFAIKMGLDKMSNYETSNLKVKFNIDSELGDKSLNEWKTRLLLLTYNNYQFDVLQNGYGMLSYNPDDNTAYDIKTSKYITYSFLNQIIIIKKQYFTKSKKTLDIPSNVLNT